MLRNKRRPLRSWTAVTCMFTKTQICPQCHLDFIHQLVRVWLNVAVFSTHSGRILGLCPTNERRCYFVTMSLIGWAQGKRNVACGRQQFGMHFYASAFRRRRHYVFGLSVRPSVRPSEAWNTLFWPVHRSVGPPDQPLPFYGMSVRPSVRPERFPGICRRLHGGISLKFYMLMYLDHLQNWLVYGHGLVIFLILALFGLSETGQIWGFRVFPGECMEEMTWNFARWCILTTFRTD